MKSCIKKGLPYVIYTVYFLVLSIVFSILLTIREYNQFSSFQDIIITMLLYFVIIYIPILMISIPLDILRVRKLLKERKNLHESGKHV